MARRSLSIRSTLLARRSNPSFTYISQYNDCKKTEDLHSFRSKIETFLAQMKSLNFNPSSAYCSWYNSCKKSEGFLSSGSKIETLLARRMSLGSYVSKTFCRRLFGNDISLRREMSTSSEVAIAAADSAFPSAVVQQFIDSVHCVTGLNWWASIAVATLLARVAILPLTINYIREQSFTVYDDWTISLPAGRKRDAITIVDGVQPHSFARLVISTSFFFAIRNMAEKVPSFKTGGALWFTDLSTSDTMCILPISMALIYLLRKETCVMMIPNPKDVNRIPSVLFLKIVYRTSAALLIPLTMFFPKAILCSWITSSMLNCCLSFVMRVPRVQKALRLPPTITISPEYDTSDTKKGSDQLRS